MTSTVAYPTGRVLVQFAGPGAGDEELAWGQSEIWRAMTREGNWFPLGGVSSLSAGTTVDDIAAELSYLLGRYQTMRTRLRFTPDGRPRQVVASSGEIALEVVEAGDADPEEVAAAVLWRYQHTDYDFEHEWPVRMAVIRQHGVLTHQVSIVCHLVTDSAGGAVMLAEVGARETAPVSGLTSLEQARWQQSAAGRRRNRAAQRHWETLLLALTPMPVDTSTDRRTPRFWQAEFTSPATRLAVRVISARLQMETSPIVLTLFAAALAGVTGVDPMVLRPIVSNRFHPGLANVVANVSQNGLCLLDIADIDFDTAAERTRRATMTAFKHAYFDPIEMDELIARVSQERGVDVDVRCFYSDRRASVAVTGPTPAPQDLDEALPRSTFGWVAEHDVPLDRLMCYVDDAPDALKFSVFVDTHFLSPADTEACLRAVETMAVRAAYDPTASTTTTRTVSDRTAAHV
jgi:hypothetical protein